MESSNNMKEQNELEVEEQVILISSYGSIVIDENTTFIDDEGNPVIVNRQAEGENIEFIFQGENDATDKTERISNDAQEHASMEQEDSLTVSNNLFEAAKNFEETAAVCKSVIGIENNEVEKINKPIKPIQSCGSKVEFLANSFNEFLEKLRDNEIKTCTKYVCTRSPLSFKTDNQGSLEDPLLTRGKILHWHGAVPYLHFGTRTYSCHQGKDLNVRKKQKYAEERDNLARKNNIFIKRVIQPTKKLGCPVTISVTCMYRMSNYEIPKMTKSNKKNTSKRIKEKINKNESLGGEFAYLFNLPELSDHKNHKQTKPKRTVGSRGKKHTEAQKTENIFNDLHYENILGDMPKDTADCKVQTKKKDIEILEKAFDSEQHNPNLSDADSVNQWVISCSQREDSPILFYRRDGKDILLVIMTEFQKSILLSSNKQILSIDSEPRKRSDPFYLLTFTALDGCETAFPVAFCISSKVDKSTVKHFLMSIKDSTGPLSCSYFMSDHDSFYYKAWKEVMQDEPKWIWSKWFVEHKFYELLKASMIPTAARTDWYKRLKLLLDCKNTDNFETMFQNCITDLCVNPATIKVANSLSHTYGNSKESWAYCYHQDLTLSSVAQYSYLHQIMMFCCKRSRKNRLDNFILAMMKLMRFKMLDRLIGMLDDEKVSLAVETINMHHNSGLEISTDCISSVGDKIWMIISENDEENSYVYREYDSCPDFCLLKCSECNICVHMFSCSCIPNLINGDLCPHVHAVVQKFFHFASSLTSSHDAFGNAVHTPLNYSEDLTLNSDTPQISNTPSQPSEPFDTVLNMTREVFQKVLLSKSTLNEATLNALKEHLNCCIDLCSGKDSIPDSNNVPQPNVTDSATQTFVCKAVNTVNKTNPKKSIFPRNSEPSGENTVPNTFIVSNPIGFKLPTNPKPKFKNTSPQTFVITTQSYSQGPQIRFLNM